MHIFWWKPHPGSRICQPHVAHFSEGFLPPAAFKSGHDSARRSPGLRKTAGRAAAAAKRHVFEAHPSAPEHCR